MTVKRSKFYHLKKGTIIACGVLMIGAMATYAKAGCKVYGTIRTSVHIIPILQDTVTGTTSTTADKGKISSVKSKTTVYAYNSDGAYNVNSSSATGAQAYEGTGGKAVASIRGMKKAKGIHKGTNGTVSTWVTVNTKWNKQDFYLINI